ncbi:MAG: rod shape-determining protein MreC, partial [Acidobacteriota bacterium]
MTHRTLLYRSLLLWALFEIGAAAQVHGPSGASVLTSWMRALIAPPVALVENLADTVGDLAGGLGDARTLASKNRVLTEELANLRSRNAALQTDLQATLQAAESLKSLPMFSGTPARCLYRDIGRGLLLVSMDTDAPKTIHRDTPVLGAGGVIGRVIRVEGRNCWVESLTRSAAAVAVTTADGSTQGLAEGTGGPNLEIHFVSHRASLTVDQDLVTSGADGIYVPGFPVAKIISVRESGGAFLEITAR